MRRAISIAMAVFGLSVVITGIEKLIPPFSDVRFMPHIISSIAFGVLVVIHTWLNRKPLIRHFRGLGWWWGLVGLGFAFVIWGCIVAPVMVVNGRVG